MFINVNTGWELETLPFDKQWEGKSKKESCIQSCSDSMHCIKSGDVACAAPTVQFFAAESNLGSTNNLMKIGISCTQAAGNYPAKSQLHDWKIGMLHGWKKTESRNANEMQKKDRYAGASRCQMNWLWWDWLAKWTDKIKRCTKEWPHSQHQS